MTSPSIFDMPSRRNRTDKKLHGKEGAAAVERVFQIVKLALQTSGKRAYGKATDNIKLHVESRRRCPSRSDSQRLNDRTAILNATQIDKDRRLNLIRPASHGWLGNKRPSLPRKQTKLEWI